TSALEVDGLQERTLYVQTFSKKYCMTGFRVGYVAGAKDLIAAIAQLHRTFNGSVPEQAQLAALAAVSLPESVVTPMMDEYAQRLDLVLQLFLTIRHTRLVFHEGAYYSLLPCDGYVPSPAVGPAVARRRPFVRAAEQCRRQGPHSKRLW